MPLHLVKLCVGVDSLDHLRGLQRARLDAAAGTGGRGWLNQHGLFVHRTRQMPRRRDELLDGGSLYWVIKGVIQARQKFSDIAVAKDSQGRRCCDLIYGPDLISVRPQPRRAFQGWRYLDAGDAPTDLDVELGDIEQIPARMRRDLMELALL